jgi:formylglycine-generating enzyme
MIPVLEGYCIDSTEVTRAQYAAWLNGNPPTAGQIANCAWNTTFAPDVSCTRSACQTGCDQHPQVCVDWCDAYAYCQAVGKRLCGKIGGGSNGYSDHANASLSQWYNACTSHDPTVNIYPYGTHDDAQACNGWAYSGGDYMTVAVGTLPNCQSRVAGYSGVYDLSGNVEEWEDSCTGDGVERRCRVRGGAFHELDMYLTCDADFAYACNTGTSRLGIRCCSSP